jgi:hypothetical protein
MSGRCSLTRAKAERLREEKRMNTADFNELSENG